ncbi:hypothetical protein L1887_16553 [Cichorium endivia]|nr:hypothetical protein L1887_16553 [Cichorium endivia]
MYEHPCRNTQVSIFYSLSGIFCYSSCSPNSFVCDSRVSALGASISVEFYVTSDKLSFIMSQDRSRSPGLAK